MCFTKFCNINEKYISSFIRKAEKIYKNEKTISQVFYIISRKGLDACKKEQDTLCANRPLHELQQTAYLRALEDV